MTSRATWKSYERRLARDLGTARIPVTGERDGADFLDGLCAYQAKKGRRFPAYLRDWLRGIKTTAERTGRIGVVIWQAKHQPDADALVILRFADWCALHGPPTRGDDAP